MDKGDGKQHVRYGTATKIGGRVEPELLAVRAANALNYKLKVAIASNQGENNEVIISVGQHAGLFPMVGFSSNEGYQLFSLSTKEVGTLQDNGTLTPV